MTAQDWLEQLGFILVAAFTLGSALGVILARRVLHAALWLLPTLVGIAGIFALLGAHLLFAMQIIVYVGAITVLIVFAVMLLEDQRRDRPAVQLPPNVPRRLESTARLVLHLYGGMQHVLAGVVASGFMLIVILAAVIEAAWYQQWEPLQAEGQATFAGDNVKTIGELFLTKYLLPFEVASVVLLVALVGAVVIARHSPRSAESEAGAEAEESQDAGGDQA